MRQKIIAFLKFQNLEALTWIAGLAYLAFVNPIVDSHLAICPIKNLGFSFCPGCGLGESISYLFRFEFKESFSAHPLGLFAVIILFHRVFFLLKKSYQNNLSNYSHKLGVKNNG